MEPQNQIDLIQKHTDQRTAVFYSFCDRVITLSTGALALSITFRSSFTGSSSIHLWLLRFAWICFTVAILAALITHLGRIRSHTKVISELLQDSGRVVVGSPGRFFTCAIWAMYASFFLAIASLAGFAFINLR
jgi:hypothetical protein